MVSDWSEGVAPSEDYKKYKRAQGRVEAKTAPRRVVGPSSTQLQLVRGMVRAIYDENSELRQSRWLRGRRGEGMEPFFFFACATYNTGPGLLFFFPPQSIVP